MITNARVLQSEFVPNDVKHRPAEVSHLSDTLRPVTNGNRPEPSFLYGPSGAGKTCIARHTVEQLRENVVDLNTQYVNCWEEHTAFQTLYRVLDAVGNTHDIHRRSTPTDELVQRLREYDGPQYIVILDEVDQLEDKEILYDFYRIRNLSMILIANREEDVFSDFDGRLNSRLQTCIRIRFNQYSLDQLVTILEDRVQWGLEQGAIETQGLERIADHAAGDARIAIGLLRNAARQAVQQQTEQITDDVIDAVVSETKSEIRQKTTDKLTPHQQVLYDLITETDRIGAGNLYSAYCETVEDPKTRRTMRNHLSKLQQYNLITASGNTRNRTYSACG
ncbi:AAA family ATPase [Halonotius terrestris]|uniref:AAA family ATPase n=1 Tax=Halonotius terrestris TaxID=2487750 RepID=A0A8J8PD62_9EURY|nr:Cdc6/Cdc18 family protein [Halonotius terrestris]TQQ83037.1 AAA family ATPase [Halonotius terrestris]